MKQIILLLLTLYINSWAQVEQITYLVPSINAFIQNIGGPNEAYSIGAGDLFINPALISRCENSEIQFSNLLNGYSLKYLSTAWVTKLSENSYMGFGVFGINIPVSETYDGSGYKLRYQDNYQMNFNISYAYKFPIFTIGTSIKYLYYNMDSNDYESKTQSREIAFGFFKRVFNNMDFGMVYNTAFSFAKNPDFNNPLGSRFGLGFVWDALDQPTKKFNILLSLDKVENHGMSLNYGIIAQLLSQEQISAIGIKSLSFKYGSGNYNMASFKLPGHKLRFLNEKDRNKMGLGLEFSSIYNLEFGFNFCFQYDELMRNMNLITTRMKF